MSCRPLIFFADSMLGRLARWLRIMGYDTRYEHDIPDEEIVRRSSEEDRIILTRDTLLVKRRRVNRYLFIESDHVREQLRQVVYAYGLEVGRPFTRCLGCNVPIAPVDRRKIRSLVPPYVYRTRSWFAQCPACAKVYWQGTHIDHVRNFLKGI